MSSPPLTLTLGALQAGTLVSTALSGAVGFQSFLYWRSSHGDPKELKAFVFFVWALDAVQTSLIAVVSWQYLIHSFSNPSIADHIFPTIPATVSFTALLTFLVNGYFIMRVHKLSKGNWWFTLPTTFFLVARLGLAFVSTAEMVRLKSFDRFHDGFGPVFTAGLSLSALTDILVTLGQGYYLRDRIRGVPIAAKAMKEYVFVADNNGAATCLVALASLICWVTMPNNLVFMALHFCIGKIYSNSLLASLNIRRSDMRVKIIAPAQVPTIERQSHVQDLEHQSTFSSVEHGSSESIGYVTFASSHRTNTRSEDGSAILSFAEEKDVRAGYEV
ncbi:hypothetical protein PENSPDRAFT_654509 [Peniophora sp. CONT]|nr:hypothetical protein PENSPDRAFT_654509 [Peniophora sp. CONT]